MTRAKLTCLRVALLTTLVVALSSCGGAGGDDQKDSSPSMTVSGQVTAADGTPLARVAITSEVTSSCPIIIPPYFSHHVSFGRATTDASGRYEVTAFLSDDCPEQRDAVAVLVRPSSRCDASRSNPCYLIRGERSWRQKGLSPSAGVNFIGERRSKVFAVVSFPNGTPPAAISATRPSIDGNRDADDEGHNNAGALTFGFLHPGHTYTLYFQPNAQFRFDPPEFTFTASADDLDVPAFAATPVITGTTPPTPSYADTSFGTNGVASHPVEAGVYEFGQDIVADPNGGYYVLGGADSLGVIWRITESGALDSNFATSGYRISGPFPISSGLLANGQLYAVATRGSAAGGKAYSRLMCITESGANCSGFNAGESLDVPTLAWSGISRDPIAGDLVLAGRPVVGDVPKLSVTRVSAAGVLGMTYTNAYRRFAYGMAVDVNGSAYVANSTHVGLTRHVYILRLTSGFDLDTTFNSRGSIPGTLDFDIEHGGDGGRAALMDDGSVLVASGGSVTRVTTAGTVDASFATGGTLYSSLRAISRIVVDSAGRIVVFGSSFGGARVCRFSSSGVIDGRFYSGCVTLKRGNSSAVGTVDALDRILVTHGDTVDMTVHRLNP